MQYLVGTDEAGYGPNFGPLVVTATVWKIPEQQRSQESRFDLFRAFRNVITSSSAEEKSGARAKLRITDSKALYKPRGPLTALEQACFSMLAAANAPLPNSWREIWAALDPASADWIRELPWYSDYDERLPVDCDATSIAKTTDRLKAAFEKTQIRLLRVCSHVVFADHFNALLHKHTNKSESLSRVTLELVTRAMNGLPTGNVRVECDKHGGRNRYSALLQDIYPDHLVEVYEEGRDRSRYQFGPEGERSEFLFSARGESALPTALASIYSKYLRELAMRSFNSFWDLHVDELKPTAGYPVDARRFRDDIATAQAALGIEDSCIWRAK